MTHDNRLFAQEPLCIAYCLLRQVCPKTYPRIAVAWEVNRVHFETAVGQSRTQELHDLFARIETMNDQNASRRWIAAEVVNVRRWRIDRHDARFTFRFECGRLRPGQHKYCGGRNLKAKAGHTRMLS